MKIKKKVHMAMGTPTVHVPFKRALIYLYFPIESQVSLIWSPPLHNASKAFPSSALEAGVYFYTLGRVLTYNDGFLHCDKGTTKLSQLETKTIHGLRAPPACNPAQVVTRPYYYYYYCTSTTLAVAARAREERS